MLKIISGKYSIVLYGIANFFVIFAVNLISDLPVYVGNWEQKASLIASFQNPKDNFYPPGGAIMLIPFLGLKPHFEIAVFFYFTCSSIIYYMICSSLIKNKFYFYVALTSFTFNPYLLWLVNSSQDIVFELFLLLSGFALTISKKYILALFPIYLLCLTRPQYWPCFLLLPIAIRFLGLKNKNEVKLAKKMVIIPFLFLLATLSINQLVFKSAAIAGESGLTAHFGHNKNWYLSMPKFDTDVFLSTGGNMDANKVLEGSSKFGFINDLELRAALVSVIENPKSLFLNTLQKVDTYFFAVQKNPQLSGEFFLAPDQKSIVLGTNRESWTLLIGSALYFVYRALLLIFTIASITILVINPTIRKKLQNHPVVIFCIPYLTGSVAAIIFSTETRLKIVSELLLVPLVLYVFDLLKINSQQAKLN